MTAPLSYECTVPRYQGTVETKTEKRVCRVRVQSPVAERSPLPRREHDEGGSRGNEGSIQGFDIGERDVELLMNRSGIGEIEEPEV